MDEQQAAVVEEPGIGSLAGAYAEEVTARVNAVAYQNLSLRGCGLCGDATLTRTGDEVVIEAHRAAGVMSFLYITTLLLFVFACVAVVLMMLPLLPWAAAYSSSVETDAVVLRWGMSIAVVLFALNRTIAAVAGRGDLEEVRVRRAGLHVGGSARQRVLRGALGRKGKNRIMVIKPASKADKELLAKVLA